MIAVYAIGQVKRGDEVAFKSLAQRFIQESRTHKGCISYDCGEVSGFRCASCDSLFPTKRARFSSDVRKWIRY